MNDSIRLTLTSNVYDVAIKTPLEMAEKLSKLLGNNVYLKREDLQPIKSFKIRGAYNKIINTPPKQRQSGVIAASAGNHAQGVAYSAKKLGINVLIVMPKTTPQLKIDAVLDLGAEVELHGDNYSEAADYCKSIIEKTGMTYIPPFDDELVIAGQGTVGKEVLEQLPEASHIFIPVGGGGLAAGIALYVKHVSPSTKIIGVEPEDSNAMQLSLKSGKLEELSDVGIFADGVAVKQVGEHTLALAKQYFDDCITVSTDQLCASIKYIYEDNRSIVEPAGALAVAGMIKYASNNKLTAQNFVAINSGANMNFERLQYISERTLIGSGKEVLYSITLPESAGALEKVCIDIINQRSISEFNYRLYRRDQADVFVGIILTDVKDKKHFEKHLEDGGYEYKDLSDNDLAKLHVRHMIGGRADKVKNEKMVSFVFPEKPGALTGFLIKLSKQWNISLFHFRNLGGDVGRVLIGFEVDPNDEPHFSDFLETQDFPYQDETDNYAYSHFLRPHS